MIELSLYSDGPNYDKRCYINEDDISSISDYNYHSFRPSIGKITMKNGETIIVWESASTIYSKLNKICFEKGL